MVGIKIEIANIAFKWNCVVKNLEHLKEKNLKTCGAFRINKRKISIKI